MKRVNIVLLDKQADFVSDYKKSNGFSCLDEVINDIILKFKRSNNGRNK